MLLKDILKNKQRLRVSKLSREMIKTEYCVSIKNLRKKTDITVDKSYIELSIKIFMPSRY